VLQLYPEKYDQLDLSAEEKSFVRTLERAFSDEEMAYFVLHINPRRKDVGDGKSPELFNLLLLKEGLLLLRFLDMPNEVVTQATIKAISNPIVFDILISDITKRLEESRYLTNESGNLQCSLNICFVVPKYEAKTIMQGMGESERDFCHKHILFSDTIKAIRKNGMEIIKGIIPADGHILHEDLVNYVFQRLCPEITIPRKFILDENMVIAGMDAVLNATDRAVQSYRLDKKQIDIINRIAKGNQLILACAGSGKSVLLISKCFKLASLNPGEQFLITCYNRNLHSYYSWAIAQAGFTDKNVRCITFFTLCKTLLENNGIPTPSKYWAGDQFFDRLFESANDALAQGRIKERYYGIFIDEVQIFKPEWYRFCFNLLKSKDADSHVFVIAGDKSQDIKNNIKHGKAPWQGGGDAYPGYRGKTRTIETNYRNSKPINDAIDRYVGIAKRFGATLGIDLTSDPELFLRGTAYREGNNPVLVELEDLSNNGEGDAVCDAIKNYIESKGLSEVDIAVVLYNRRIRKYYSKFWKDKFYDFQNSIRRRFIAEDWEQPAILIGGESEGITYGSRRGVTITTIEGSLGLDFRAVILAGLLPLGIHEKARSIKDFETPSLEKFEAFKKNINFLYTGCTRAKDELTIILSAPRGESIYMDLLRDSIGGAAQ